VSRQGRGPWDITERRLPKDASTDDKLRAAVDYAVLAPSGHNTQPWRFKVVDSTLELWADRTRALAVVDPHDRELTISCGAALAFVRIVFGQLGQDAVTEVLPEPDERDLLARVRLGAPREADERDTATFAAISRRRTMREPFKDRELPPELMQELELLAEREGAWFAGLELDRRNEIAALVDEGDRVQAADPHFRRELAAWFRPNNTASRDGIPATPSA
jgi:nitroreductase